MFRNFRALELLLLLMLIIDVSVVAVIDGYNGESLWYVTLQ